MIKLLMGATLCGLPRLTHVSCRTSDHGHKNWMALGASRDKVVVTLDGHRVNRCISADARYGYVDFLAARNGQITLGRFKDAPVYHRLYGRVEITCQ